jgi:hypothetical protein
VEELGVASLSISSLESQAQIVAKYVSKTTDTDNPIPLLLVRRLVDIPVNISNEIDGATDADTM